MKYLASIFLRRNPVLFRHPHLEELLEDEDEDIADGADELQFVYEMVVKVKQPTDELGLRPAADKVFYKLNARHPKGYNRRSLSEGDVLHLRALNAEGVHVLLVESFGYKHIETPREVAEHLATINSTTYCWWSREEDLPF